jgi:hypothetical protein
MIEWWVPALFILAAGGAPLLAYWLATRKRKRQ